MVFRREIRERRERESTQENCPKLFFWLQNVGTGDIYIGNMAFQLSAHLVGSPTCWKNTCLYHIQNIRSRKLTNLLHLQLITCTMLVSEFKNKKAYLGAMKFKNKSLEVLRNTFNLHSNSTWCSRIVVSQSISKGRIRKCLTLTYTPFHSLYDLIEKPLWNFVRFSPFI